MLSIQWCHLDAAQVRLLCRQEVASSLSIFVSLASHLILLSLWRKKALLFVTFLDLRRNVPVFEHLVNVVCQWGDSWLLRGILPPCR